MNSRLCQYVKPDGVGCKRPVAVGQKFCWQHSHGIRAKFRSLTRNQTIIFWVGVAGLVATLGFGILSLLPHIVERELPRTRVPELEPRIAMEATCDETVLPVIIAPHTSLHVVAVNPKRMKQVRWGSVDIPNESDAEQLWPDKRWMEESRKRKNLGVFINRCESSNHSEVNVLDVVIPMRFWFGGKGGDENAVPFAPIVGALDVGHGFIFYFVNNCPIRATAILANQVSLLVVGETTRRITKLSLPHRNPVESIMMWPPATLTWIDADPCE